MDFEPFDPVADTGKIRACYDMRVAGKAVDDPLGPPISLPVFTGWLSEDRLYSRREGWLVPGGQEGTWDGACIITLPVRDNTHRANVGISVAVGKRRAGVGSALLRHALERAAANGRTLVMGGAREDTPGAAFAAASGARAGIVEVRRVLDLDGIPGGLLAALRGRAEEAAPGYSLVSWEGGSPEEHVDQVAKVTLALEDAPHSPGHKPMLVDADRIREDERRVAVQRLRYYSVAARHDGTGELAAITQLGVDPEAPDWGCQELTAVIAPHRGHRLGLLVKVAMLEWLAKAEPGLERILTGNADANSHMIAINAELGFRILDYWKSWQLDVPQPAAAR